MKQLANLLLAAVMVSLVAAGPARAEDEDSCHKIDVTGVGQITSQTNTGGTTESKLIGNGLLKGGTTTSVLVFTGFDPETGDLFYAGTLVVTTKHGTLTLAITDGVLAPNGEFSNGSKVTAGTRKFEEATGHLYFHGFVAADGSFIDDAIKGEICLDD